MSGDRWCLIGFHDWEKWRAPIQVAFDVTHQTLNGVTVALDKPLRNSEWRQARACNRCGKVQHRYLEKA